MHKLVRSVLATGMAGVVLVLTTGCRKDTESAFPISDEEVAIIVKDLSRRVNPDELSGAERRAFQAFGRFLAIRRYCDRETAAKRMTDQEAVDATQPSIDRLVARGEPTESVMLKLLEARRTAGKALDAEKGQGGFPNEDPDIFATIVLWNQKSERAVPVLMELAKDKTFRTRAVFVRGLARIGDVRALDLLRDLAANDPNEEVQKEAKDAIAAITKVATPEKE